jgi:hypothetical protein
MAQRKETKKTIQVRDLKPKKDAKGGFRPPGGYINRQTNQQGVNQNHSQG